jgi:hypothetical protein
LPQSNSKLERQPCWVACLLVCVSGPPCQFSVRIYDYFYRFSAKFEFFFKRKIQVPIFDQLSPIFRGVHCTLTTVQWSNFLIRLANSAINNFLFRVV